MSASKDQVRQRMFHEFQLGHNAATACRNICAAMGDKAVAESTVRKWFSRFREGDTNLRDKPRAGAPSSIDDEAVLAAIHENPNFTTRMLADEFQCTHTTIENILHKNGKKWRHGKWTPHE